MSASESIFNAEYLNNRDKRFNFDLNTLPEVPFSKGEQFNIEAGNIEKGKVIVQVFEVSTTYATFLKGIDANNKGIDLENIIRVGSMSEASINGNWGGNTTHSLFDLAALKQNATEQYHLSIQLGLNGFSCIRKDNVILAIESYTMRFTVRKNT